MNIGYIERIATKAFKIENTAVAVGTQFDLASVYFVRAAIVEESKLSPFEGLVSSCSDVSEKAFKISSPPLFSVLICQDIYTHCAALFEINQIIGLFRWN
jgi:hypothetical protein